MERTAQYMRLYQQPHLFAIHPGSYKKKLPFFVCESDPLPTGMSFVPDVVMRLTARSTKDGDCGLSSGYAEKLAADGNSLAHR